MMDISLYFTALGAMLLAAVLFWLLSLAKRDVSIVDSLWALFFIIAALLFFDTDGGLRNWIILGLVLIWGIRLSAFVTLRNWGRPEDHRYQQIRNNNQPHFGMKSLYLIFALQACLAWIIAMPLLAPLNGRGDFALLDMFGMLLWLIGMGFEVTADQQLRHFKQDPANRGKVMNRGLWQYTRHPNYFGEFLIWWGYYCFALSSGAWWSIISPLLMSWLLLRFSGVTLLEKTMSKRPGYAQYMQTTNAFIPGPRHGQAAR